MLVIGLEISWHRYGWITLGLAAGLGVSGCSRANPSFGDDDADADAPTSSGSSPIDTGATSSIDPTASADSTSGKGGTSDGADDPGTTDAPGSTGSFDTGEPSGSESSGGNPGVCELHADAPISITIDTDGGVLMPVGDCSLMMQRPNGIITVLGDTITHQICDTCNCAPEPGATVDFGGTLVVPGLPDCGKLIAWGGHAPDGTCRWDGVAVLGQFETTIPHFVAANSRELPLVPFGPVTVGLGEGEICEGLAQCANQVGRYALTFFEGDAVFVGMPAVVTMNFVAAVDFLVTNRMASIDQECGEHVAWTALVQL